MASYVLNNTEKKLLAGCGKRRKGKINKGNLARGTPTGSNAPALVTRGNEVGESVGLVRWRQPSAAPKVL